MTGDRSPGRPSGSSAYGDRARHDPPVLQQVARLERERVPPARTRPPAEGVAAARDLQPRVEDVATVGGRHVGGDARNLVHREPERERAARRGAPPTLVAVRGSGLRVAPEAVAKDAVAAVEPPAEVAEEAGDELVVAAGGLGAAAAVERPRARVEVRQVRARSPVAGAIKRPCRPVAADARVVVEPRD